MTWFTMGSITFTFTLGAGIVVRFITARGCLPQGGNSRGFYSGTALPTSDTIAMQSSGDMTMIEHIMMDESTALNFVVKSGK